MGVSNDQRFDKSNPCPICHGGDSDPRGESKRCHGFMSIDGQWAHCTREEHAGQLTVNPSSQTYAHKLNGSCRCGSRHGKNTSVGAKASKIVATYGYLDESGKLISQTVRYQPKGFKQRRPDGKGGWIWNLNGIHPVPYRLPELLSHHSGPVFVPEGEKDVESIRSLGSKFVATCNPGGAGKWRAEFSEFLKGQTLVLLPDNDEPGRSHAFQVGRSLLEVGASVKVIQLPNLPEKGDVSDWIASGGTAEELSKLAAEANPIESPEALAYALRVSNPDSRSLGQEVGTGLVRVWTRPEPPPRTFPVEGLLPGGAVSILYGDGGLGKSYLALSLACHVVTGQPFFGHAVQQRNVLYLDAELDQEEFERRAYWVARGLGLKTPPIGLHYHRLSGPLQNPHIQSGVLSHISESSAGLVVLDSLTASTFGSEDISDAAAVVALMQELQRWGPTVLALDHVSKPTPGVHSSHYRPFGSVFKYNLARSVIQLVGDGDGLISLRQTKVNFSRKREPLNLFLEFKDDSISITQIEDGDERLVALDVKPNAMERVASALNNSPDGVLPESLADKLNLRTKTVKNHLTELRKQGRATPRGSGLWSPNGEHNTRS